MRKDLGVILTYPPEILFGFHGIPRLIMNIIKGAHNKGYNITIITPKWSEKELETLLTETLGENYKNIDIITTARIPPVLHVRYYLFRMQKSLKKGSFLSVIFQKVQNKMEIVVVRLLGSHNFSKFFAACLLLLFFSPLFILYFLEQYTLKKRNIPGKQNTDHGSLKREFSDYFEKFSDPAKLLKLFYLNEKIFSELLRQENKNIVKITEKQRENIPYWLITTPFWPDLTKNIKNSTVICPDVVIRDFAVSFEREDFGEKILNRKDDIRRTLQTADKIICFSEYVKNNQIIASFGNVDLDKKISVIPHGHINLSDELEIIKPFHSMNKVEQWDLSKQIINTYTRQMTSNEYLANFDFSGTRFLFYSSQIRPSKNIPALIKTLHRLLHHKHEPVKLILTGSPGNASIMKLISDLGLQRDVIFFSGLPTRVMAALYHQAILAVNPTLFEGGFPFTFSEAYSVGTPSIMSRIPVVEEFITDPDLQKVMLFDPHNIDDMVERIYWGIHHRDELYNLQKPLYDRLKNRSLAQVAQEYIDVVNHVD